MVSNSYNWFSSHHASQSSHRQQLLSGPAECLDRFLVVLQLSCLEICEGEFAELCQQAHCLQIVKLCKYSEILLLTTKNKLGRNVINLTEKFNSIKTFGAQMEQISEFI